MTDQKVDAADVPQVVATLYLRLGAELQAEPWEQLDLTAAWTDAAAFGGIDGGLLLQAAGCAPASRADMWDQIDGVLLAWLKTLAEIADGAQAATAEFPDTRIECEVARMDADTVSIHYEDVHTTLPLRATQDALQNAARRLVQAAESHTATAALVALRRDHL